MKIKLEGVGKLNTALSKVENKLHNQASKLIAGAALRTDAVAKERLKPLPGDSGKLVADISAVRQSINFKHDAKTLSAMVFAGNVTGENLAAYLEFGTGKYAAKYVGTLPAPYPALAMQFFVNGKGWTRAHPFLIPAYRQESGRLADKLKGLKIGW